jgi:CHASE2 domain-containing sensor protein/predicted Ser/Thr protein kinase
MQVTHGVAVALLCWLLLAVLYLAGAFHSFDLKILDWRFRVRGERSAPDSIALIGVDDATIRAYGAWPLPRESYALLLAAVEDGGARAVGVDLQFPEDANQDPQWNQLLAFVSGSHENLVQSIWFHAYGAEVQDREPRSAEVMDALARHGVVAEEVDGAAAGSVSLPYDDLVLDSKMMGHISAAVDRDGAIRRIPLVIRYGDRVYPALTLCLLGLSQGESRLQGVRAARGGVKVRWPHGRELFFPVDREGATAIDYAGDRAAFRNTYSMLEVLQWKRAEDTKRISDAFSGRTVLVGLTSRQEVSEDVGTTPFSTATPLLFVHANVLDNMLRGRFLTRIPDAAYLGALAVLAVLFGTLFALVSVPVAAILTVATVVALAALDFALLAVWSVDVPPVVALLLPPLAYAAAQSYRYIFLERRTREREADIRQGITVQQRFLPEALVGQTLSHYYVEEKIDGGGQGVVYRGRDQRLGRAVAIKVLPGGALEDERTRRRFRREARALSRFSHPHIAGIYDFDTQNGADFIVMEYIEGTSVAKRLHRGPIPELEAVLIAVQITEALVEAHAQGIIHRDIKPGNVVLTPRGDAKLLDFGLAHIARVADSSTTTSGRVTESGHVVGTLPYMAPEVLSGETADARVDVYGVGVLLFEMTTGKRPFDEDQPHELMSMILHQPPPDPRVLQARISVAVRQVILDALEKDPSNRPATALDLLTRLRSVNDGTGIGPA